MCVCVCVYEDRVGLVGTGENMVVALRRLGSPGGF